MLVELVLNAVTFAGGTLGAEKQKFFLCLTAYEDLNRGYINLRKHRNLLQRGFMVRSSRHETY